MQVRICCLFYLVVCTSNDNLSTAHIAAGDINQSSNPPNRTIKIVASCNREAVYYLIVIIYIPVFKFFQFGYTVSNVIQ